MALIEGCKHEIEIVVPLEEVAKETERVVASIQQRAKLPGFRPGKAPASIIRQKFGSEIRQDVLEQVVPKAFRAKAGEDHLQVVGTPNVKEVHFHDGEPLRFKAEFEVAPEWTLGEYRDLPVPYGEKELKDEDVDKRIEEIRTQKAEFVNEDPRPLAAGDYAVVSLRSLSGITGAPIQSDEMVLHLGDDETLPEFTEHLTGMSPDDEKEFDVKYPDDYGQERLAGQTVRFAVQLKGVRRRELPELNDDFAQDLGDYKDLGELREAIRRAMKAEAESEAQREAKDKLIETLVDQHEFAVPDAYVERQIDAGLEQSIRSLAAQGVDPGKLNLDWEKLRESQRDRAIRQVRGSLVLERIADSESIFASNEEVDRELQRIARGEREPIAVLRAKFEKDGTLARIASRIRTEKTLAYLFEHSRKTAKTAD